MDQNDLSEASCWSDESDHLGDDVMRQVGILDEATTQLDDEISESEAEPEEVGRWITAIGKALLAIFRP